MTLAAYLARHGLTAAAFAETIGVHPGTVGRYCKGLRMPRPEVAMRIRRATLGAVTADDFLDLDPQPRRKATAPPNDPGPERQAQAA